MKLRFERSIFLAMPQFIERSDINKKMWNVSLFIFLFLVEKSGITL